MASVPNSGASGPGLSPHQGHYVVFLGKTLNSHSASLHPGVYNCKWVPAICWGNLTNCGGDDLRWTNIPSGGSTCTCSNTSSHLQCNASETGIGSGSYERAWLQGFTRE